MVRTGSSPASTSRPSWETRCNSSTASKVLLVACLLGVASIGRAQPSEAEQRAKEIEAVCAKAHCRPARTVRLRQEDGTTFEKDVPRLPIVLPNGWITVYPDEEIHVELSIKGD